MRPLVSIVDTNVIVSGLVSSRAGPTTRILDAMLGGRLVFLISPDLLDEYATVLHRPRIAQRHGLTDDQIDQLLAELVASAVWRELLPDSDAPDSGDNHLWSLLAAYPEARLITGDRLLIENPPQGKSVVSPREFADRFLPD